MKTFKEFLMEQEKMAKLTGRHSPAKFFSKVNPAKPVRPVYTGMSVQKIHGQNNFKVY